jgi:hypothetical protein
MHDTILLARRRNETNRAEVKTEQTIKKQDVEITEDQLYKEQICHTNVVNVAGGRHREGADCTAGVSKISIVSTCMAK